jgi:hypothetical protein
VGSSRCRRLDGTDEVVVDTLAALELVDLVPEAVVNVWGQPNRLQIASHTSHVGDSCPDSMRRYPGMLTPSKAAVRCSERPSRSRERFSILPSMAAIPRR